MDMVTRGRTVDMVAGGVDTLAGEVDMVVELLTWWPVVEM